MYVVTVDGFEGDTRIFDLADTPSNVNKQNAIDYATRMASVCKKSGIRTKVRVTEKKYNWELEIYQLLTAPAFSTQEREV